MRNLIAAAILSLAATPVFAGGWTGGNNGAVGGGIVSCATLQGQHVAAGSTCLDANGVVVTVAGEVDPNAVIEVRRGILCPYPYRPSDSVFIGGSGYLLKDTVRARRGCL